MEYLINIDQHDLIKKSRVHDNVSFMLRGSSNNSTRLKPVVRTAASTIFRDKTLQNQQKLLSLWCKREPQPSRVVAYSIKAYSVRICQNRIGQDRLKTVRVSEINPTSLSSLLSTINNNKYAAKKKVMYMCARERIAVVDKGNVRQLQLASSIDRRRLSLSMKCRWCCIVFLRSENTVLLHIYASGQPSTYKCMHKRPVFQFPHAHAHASYLHKNILFLPWRTCTLLLVINHRLACTLPQKKKRIHQLIDEGVTERMTVCQA